MAGEKPGEDRILAGGATYIDFQTDPQRYRHWKLAVDGDVATLTMDVDENGGLFEGYQLKLNSYDLGVDIELADAVQRLRFEPVSYTHLDALLHGNFGMSGMSGSYNAVSWLLDRNIEEGRGSKLAFTDTVSELTYGELQRQSCRVANMLRRLGVRREERVAMIMLDTVDFPAVFLGAIRAGVVPVPLNTLLTSDQYAYVLADCRARVLFVSEALLPGVKDLSLIHI